MSKKVLAILGAGELGKQIANIAIEDNHYDSTVFYDDNLYKTKKSTLKVLGPIEDDIIFKDYKNKVFSELIVGVGYNYLFERKKLFEKFSKNIKIATIIHSSSFIDTSAIIKSGTVIYPNCTIDKAVVVQENTVINLSSVISHDSKIGAHSFLSPGVCVAGNTSLGKMCFFGISTTISGSVYVCDKVQTGAGTVVVDNLTKQGLYFGVPARKK